MLTPLSMCVNLNNSLSKLLSNIAGEANSNDDASILLIHKQTMPIYNITRWRQNVFKA